MSLGLKEFGVSRLCSGRSACGSIVRADCVVVTVSLWFDCASRLCSGYSEPVVRLCKQTV
jgi:hypothetical protein